MSPEKGKVSIPGDYFLKMAKHDYGNYREALPREFYQNSIDAGATKIEVSFDDEARTIQVADNGCGMDLSTIKEKLLVLGGSKKGEGAVGAFGKAKEVLFFSWVQYEIRTGDLVVQGSGAAYCITRNNPFYKGTVCRIWIQEDEDFASLWSAFLEVAGRMEVKARFIVGGTRVQCLWRKRRLVREEDWGNIYHVKSEFVDHMAVRVNGIWMFDQYVGSGMGRVTLELTKSSLEMLSSNRDGFKGNWRDVISLFLNELAADKKSALRPRPQVIKERISGTGKIQVGQDESYRDAVQEKLEALHPTAGFAEMVAELRPVLNELGNVRLEGLATEENILHITDRIRFIGYEPDFIIRHTGRTPESIKWIMSQKKSGYLARAWTEILKQVLLDCEEYLEFTAGFVFEKGVDAMLDKESGETHILLNPTTLRERRREYILEELKERAIHEIAHLKQSYHDEDFVSEMSRIRSLTWRNAKQYSKIKHVVK